MNKTVLFSTQWYEQRVHLGVLRYAQQCGWDVVSSHHMPHLVFKLPAMDGQIVEIGPNDRQRLRLTQEFKGPVVGLEDFGHGLDIPRVHTDNLAVGRVAARHLLDRGFLNFATVCRGEFEYVRDRVNGFAEEIGRVKGTQCRHVRTNAARRNRDRLPKDHDVSTLESLVEMERPIGVFCVDDEDARAVVRFLGREEVAIPEEVALVGVNNDPLICRFSPVPISSIDPGFERIGYQAAQLLDRMMQGKSVPATTHLVQPGEVELRRSSDIQAVPDVQVAKALRFIWDHAEAGLALGDIATHVGLPVRTLQWRFSKRMGYPIQNEVTKFRVEQVRHLLVSTTRSTKQIAEDLKFSSVQYMTRMFKKETGLSPLKYRQQHRPRYQASADAHEN